MIHNRIGLPRKVISINKNQGIGKNLKVFLWRIKKKDYKDVIFTFVIEISPF